MSDRFTAACVQFTASREPAVNRAALDHLIRKAKAAGADFVMTPEVSDMLEPRRALGFAKARAEDRHRTLAAMRALAAELETWLLLGSMVVRLSDERLANRSFLIGPDGGVRARYDKIHMFDVAVGDGQTYRESSAYRPGERAVLASLPWGRLGMTICYDLRFPRLYRDLARAGAAFLAAPSAFTRVTGQAHWHILLRARAIECGAYMFAPAQCGIHDGGRGRPRPRTGAGPAPRPPLRQSGRGLRADPGRHARQTRVTGGLGPHGHGATTHRRALAPGGFRHYLAIR